MAEEENYILFKPRLACLLTHMAAWLHLGVGKLQPRDIFSCQHCGTKFYYPSKKEEYPVYGKDL